jgi:glycosyltransferase involved in cell wall biosynthesis
MRIELSVVVPCYNEESGLRELYRRLKDVCEAQVGENYELVLVNDGSKDTTWKVMKALSGGDWHIVAVNLSRNYGHQLALTAGLKICRGERVFILDADLQDPPELLEQMMVCMDAGADVAFGQRVNRAGETLFKKASAHIFYRLIGRLVDIKIPTDTGDFRLMSRRALDILNEMPEQHRFIRGMVSWIGLRQEAVTYERAARFSGSGNYPFNKMLRLALDAVTGFSVQPLRLASYLGMTCAACTLILAAFVIIQHFIGDTVAGWTSLAVIVLALGSVQMIIVGVMGEYIGRLYMQAKGRPLYVIDEVVASSELVLKPKVTVKDSVS